MEHADMTEIDHELLQDLPIGLLLLDRDNRVSWANRQLAGILGMPDTDLAGRRLGDLFRA